MIPLSVNQIAELVGGRLLGNQSRRALVDGPVEFDSRRCGPGSLFVALPGERVDGHDYLAAAARAGAVAALVVRPDQPSVPDQLARILVADAQAALGALAAAVARQLPARTIGITGSSGKTSAKDLVAALLEPLGPTIAPPGSFNNELGLPHTVLRADAGTRFLVLEYSARGVGHIEHLTHIAAPAIGAVLNVGSAHLGEFGSREAIARAKAELVEALPPAERGGVAVLNLDDPAVAAMAGRTAARVVGYAVETPEPGRRDAAAPSRAAAVRAVDVALDDLGRARFRLVCDGDWGAAGAAAGRSAGGEAQVRLRLIGAHHVGNALAAAAVALECGASVEGIAAVLNAAGPRSPGRMQLCERADGVAIVDDAYNANPESMRAAVDALARIGGARARGGGRSWAVLGSMAELGPGAEELHASLGGYAAREGISRLLAVGPDAAPIARAAAASPGWAGEAIEAADIDAALRILADQLRPGDAVLVKASHSQGLERLAQALADAEPPAPADRDADADAPPAPVGCDADADGDGAR